MRVVLGCDSLGWRADRLVSAVERLLAWGASEVVFGYRFADDAGFLVVETTAAIGELIDVAALPGLVGLPVEAEAVLGSCTHVATLAAGSDVARQVRESLGLFGDPRSAHRVVLRWPCVIEWHDLRVAGVTRDLASGGVFVEAPLEPPVGAMVRFSITLPGEARPVSGHVAVARVEKAGFGARLALSDAEEARLHQAIRRARPAVAADPRRREERLPTRLAVQVADAKSLAAAWTANLSRSGAFVRTATPPAAGSEVRIRLKTPGNETFDVGAKVVHATKDGCGIVFTDVPAQAREWIDRFLAAGLSRGARRVVVAVGDAARRAEISTALLARGCEALPAATGADALRMLFSQVFSLAAVVVGADYGDVSGAEIARRAAGLATVVTADGTVADVAARVGQLTS